MSIRQGKIIIADSVSSTTDYQDLINKPKINGVELDGNKTAEDLNIRAGITSVNGDTGTDGAVTVKAIENANPNDTMLKVWNGTTAEYLALAEKDLNTIYNVTDEVSADISKISGFNLFDFKWSDHLINNISWTRADNFSWHSAAVYVSAYNKLLKEKERASTVFETETIDDITISFYRSENNYKICLPDQLASLTSLYEKTGVAWYYVIDTENKQFKLPRTKWGFTGLRNKAGDYVPESLPNITGSWHGEIYAYESSGAIARNYGGTSLKAVQTVQTTSEDGFSFDASRSSSAYQDGAPVQERATEMYLYFYVGNTVTVESEVNLDTLVTDVENLKKGSGGSLEIGDIGFSAFGIDETKNLRRYLNGQVISQTQFTAFTTKVKAAVALYPSLSATEANWQAEVTNSKLGQCGKFVIDDIAGTIRLPKVVNINGLTDLSLIGGIKTESLPNITGTACASMTQGTLLNNGDGAFYGFDRGGSSDVPAVGGAYNGNDTWGFDASRVSSTYQDNAPVQQEAVQYPYFIQVATGSEESIDVTREIELNNPFSLLDYKWSEYEITNTSWLLSNGAFYSGATYVSVYELLLKIYNGTETKEGVSVKLSTEAYTDTDFVLNTADITFRLPVKVKLASGSAVVGNGNKFGLTNLNNNNEYNLTTFATGNGYGLALGNSGVTSDNIGITTDSTKSGIETSSAGLKLYFYVGETIQGANLINTERTLLDVANLKKNTLKTNQITNCITEIPQDIKLELKDGVLTLKAGSKVYVPNGFEADGVTKKFDVVVIENDLYLKQQFDDNDMMLFVYVNPNGIRTLGTTYKGSTYETRPAAVGDYKLHYITGENKIFWDAPNYVATENSFPIAIVDRSADVGFTSVDQVFNGFGYIGSTVFALPGVKGLIPNGRNEDGSLKNVEFTTSKVLTSTTNNTFTDLPIILKNDNNMYPLSEFLVEDRPSRTPTAGRWFSYYSPLDNKIYQSDNGNPWSQQTGYIVGIESSNGTRVTLFTTKTAFHALDYSNKSEIISWGMPDYSAGIDIKSTATTGYTTPKQGQCFVRGNSNTDIKIYINNVLVMTGSTPTGYPVPWTFDIDKGEVLKIQNAYEAKFFPFKGAN